MINGEWLLIEDINLCNVEVLKIIENMIEYQKVIITNGPLAGTLNQSNGNLMLRIHPDFRLFVAQTINKNSLIVNKNLPITFQTHFVPIDFP
jgi:midasin (ATPase involved in ribosome maturation)